METARKLLDGGKPHEALELLKGLLPTAEEKWRVHELIGAAFHDFCGVSGRISRIICSRCIICRNSTQKL